MFKKFSIAYQRLANPIIARTFTEESYIKHVATFISDQADSSFEKHFLNLLKQKKFRQTFNCYATRLEDIAVSPIFLQNMKIERLINVLKVHFFNDAVSINFFIEIRSSFERAFIDGRYELAAEILNQAEQRLGESVWLIRSKILLLAQQDKADELTRYCDDCKSRAKSNLVSILISYFQLISDANDASLLLKSIILKDASEFKEAGQEGWANLLALIFAPKPLTGDFRFSEAIPFLQVFPLIDQYTLFLEVVLHLVAEEMEHKTSGISVLHKHLKSISNHINDPAIKRLMVCIEDKADSSISQVGADLLAKYEKGDYESVIQQFAMDRDSLPNPLAYVNLIGKSLAYLHKPFKVSDRSVVDELIFDLSRLYALEGDAAHAVNRITSSTIRLKSMFFGVHIELAIYIATPQQHNKDEARYAATLALLCHSENTPIVQGLLSENQFSFGARYGQSEINDVAPYRKLKREICEKIAAGTVDSTIEQLFFQLKSTTPLIREYLELYSDYAIEFDKVMDLVRLCAESLISNQSTYDCFPMDRLALNIEERHIVSLESIVVAFFHARRSSKSKDYLLNETFEEYLFGRDASLPSDLLVDLETLTPLEVVFYRDICIPDIMDFLGCFESLNDLRAERVRILDLLLDKKLIDSATRMREVEELVDQVLVDAGTSEINSAKINVDELGLKKKHINSIASSLLLYRRAKDEGDDRITFLEAATGGETSSVYLSGNKNSIALRLVNQLIEAFLFDEKYGLDKNLSTEIRHGFFSNLIRSKLEERSLITESDESGKYRSNEFWQSQFPFVHEEVWSAVDGCLKEFSSGFNILIERAEEWMKIRTKSEQLERVFVFGLDLFDFDRIRKVMDAESSADRVFEFVMSVLWDTTETALAEVRERINVDFRNSIDQLFDGLIDKIVAAKRGAALFELMATIYQTKDDIKEDISRTAEWFRRAAQPVAHTTPLAIIADIAVNAFKDIKSANLNINVCLPYDFKQIYVPPAAVRPFVIALINLFDNACRHSGFGLGTVIDVTGTLQSAGAMICVSNRAKAEKTEELLAGELVAIKEKLSGPESAILLRTEGGSGLGKVKNQMGFISSNQAVEVSLSGDIFRVTIHYEPSAFVH